MEKSINNFDKSIEYEVWYPFKCNRNMHNLRIRQLFVYFPKFLDSRVASFSMANNINQVALSGAYKS